MRAMIRNLGLVFLLAGIVLSTSCGDDDGTSPEPEVAVSVSPSSASVPSAGSATFTATVSNASNSAVTWSATGGTIDGTGASVTWNAPSTGGTFTVSATSAEDPSKSGSASITVSQASVAISPSSATLFRGQPEDFTATVTGVAEGADGVSWEVSCGDGDADGSTLAYVAPSDPGGCVITATSTLDPSRSANADVTVRPSLLTSTLDDTDDGDCTWTHCSFREALALAQATPELDTIFIGTNAVPGVSGPTGAAEGGPATERASQVPLMGTITLADDLPAITTPLVIIGPGPDDLTIDAAATASTPRRIFDFAGATESGIVGVTMRGGLTPSSGGVALRESSDVTFRDVIITDNEATVGAGGGLSVVGASTARLIDSSVDGNRAVGASAAGGGIELVQNSSLFIQGGSVSGNSVPNGWGGGIRILNGMAELDGVTVDGNHAGLVAGGGGIMAEGTGSLTVMGSTISENTTAGGGGGLWIRGSIDGSITESVITDNEAGGGNGGAVWLDGDAVLAFLNTDMTGNTAAMEGGALRVTSNTSATIEGGTISGNQAHTGGAIGVGNTSMLVMANTVVRENGATTRAGGFFLWGNAEARLTDVVILSNTAAGSAGFGGGAGIYAQNDAVLELTGVTVAENVSQTIGIGGGITLFDGTTTTIVGGEIRNNVTEDGAGGGIFGRNATLSLDGVALRDNRAHVQGGAIQLLEASEAIIQGGEIVGNEVTSSEVSAHGGGIGMFNTSQITLDDVMFTGNRAPASGGGIIVGGEATAHIQGGTFEANEAGGVAGGVLKVGTGPMTIEGTRFIDNVAGEQGGALQLVGTGTVTLDRLTVQGNTATASHGGGLTMGAPGIVRNSTFMDNVSPGTGGGIFSSSTSTATFENLTLSGNSAAIGGGMGVTGSPTLRNLTIVLNSASEFGGGIGSNNAGAPSLVNVLLSGNEGVGAAPENCGLGGGGTMTSDGNNLSDDTSCGALSQTSDLNDVDAGVDAALADNGGDTPTHALQEGSAAIDAGQDNVCPGNDQRGFARSGPCDIGAYEFNGAAPAAGSRVTPMA